MNRFRAAAVVASAVALAAAVTAMPAAANPIHDVQVVTTGTTSTYHDRVELLAGSDERVLYVSRPHVLASSTPAANGELWVRDAESNGVTPLGAAPEFDYASWSFAGDFITAVETDTDGLGELQPVVKVFHYPYNKTREVTLPTTTALVQATPGGFVFADGAALKAWTWDNSKITDLGTPFTGQDIGSLVTDDNELVVTGATSGASAMSYEHPGIFSSLDLEGTTGPISCRAVDQFGAACSLSGPGGVGFLPLDGTAPTTSNLIGVNHVALSGTTVMWTVGAGDSSYLYSIGEGTSLLTRSSIEVSPAIVSAMGRAFMVPTGADPSQFLVAASPSDVSGFATIPASPETAGSFTLTSSRVVYVSDLRDAKVPARLLRIRSVALRQNGQRITLGAARDVSGSKGNLHVLTAPNPGQLPYGATLTATGDTTVYVLVGNRGTLGHVVIATPTHIVHLRGSYSVGDGMIQAAGHRVLIVDDRYNNNANVRIYDLRTERSQHLFAGNVPSSLALTATHLAYGSGNGVVHWRDLASGRTTTAYELPGGEAGYVTVVAHGQQVAWTIRPNHPVGAVAVHGMRDMSGGPVVTLHHTPYAMNSAGVLMRSVLGSYLQGTWFRPFQGSTQILVSRRPLDELPQLVGHTLAWVSVDGNLKVAPYKY